MITSGTEPLKSEVARFPHLLLGVMPVAVATKGPGHVEEKQNTALIRVTKTVGIPVITTRAVFKDKATAMVMAMVMVHFILKATVKVEKKV